MQPVSWSTPRLLALAPVTASSGGGKGRVADNAPVVNPIDQIVHAHADDLVEAGPEAEADSQLDHSHIHEQRAGVTGVVLQWEPVKSIGDWRPDNHTVEQVAFYRAKVPGGWLVAMKGSYQANGMGLTFYPDPLNAWNEDCSGRC